MLNVISNITTTTTSTSTNNNNHVIIGQQNHIKTMPITPPITLMIIMIYLKLCE